MRKDIEYQNVLKNTEISINALEDDCQRSPGKTKFNASALNALYIIEDRLKARAPVLKKKKK